MVQSFSVAALTSVAITVVNVCAPADRLSAPKADTAFVLMGDSARGWSRPGARALDFKRDARYCLDHSADTRADAPVGAKADAAYATFHGCMEDRDWRRPSDEATTQLIRPHETLPEEYGFWRT